MNVLSLFDGIGCGRIAFDKVGIKIYNYFASEIDSYAIKIAKENYPEIIQLGDVSNIHYDDKKQLLIDEKNNSYKTKIDILIGGSPCTGFSNAGKRLNFQDPQSKLFWEYIRLLNIIKPKYFFLENVIMKKEWEEIITKELGVKPLLINSASFSGQNRKRLYRTNIPDVTKKIISKKNYITVGDIAEKNVPENYYIKTDKKNIWEKDIPKEKQSKLYRIGYFHKNRQATRIYSFKGKSSCLVSNGGGWGGKTGCYAENKNGRFRTLTPMECERLQTIPDNYSNIVIGKNKKGKNKYISNTQRYKVINNGWTINVIAEFFSLLKKDI